MPVSFSKRVKPCEEGLLISRAEKSRCAAKRRRDHEHEEMMQLSAVLPFTPDVVDRLDKGAVIRLAISYLRMKQFIHKGTDTASGGDHSPTPETEISSPAKMATHMLEGEMMLEALNGFILFVSKKRKTMYVSDSITKHLGLLAVEMIGKPITTFIHPEDHKELLKQFIVKAPRPSRKENTVSELNNLSLEAGLGTDWQETGLNALDYVQDRLFYVRMKCQARKKGNKTRQLGYVLVQLSGRLKLIADASKPRGFSVEGLLCLCRPLQPTPIVEIRMDGNMFMSRHALDMRFTFCDPRIVNLIGYEPAELLGKTAYQFHNPLDAPKVQNCHSILIVKGTSISKYYRFLGKGGEWVWMQTRATIIYTTSNKPQYIVCMNYVIGEDEGRRNMMLEQEQMAYCSSSQEQIVPTATERAAIESGGKAIIHMPAEMAKEIEKQHDFPDYVSNETMSEESDHSNHSAVISEPCTNDLEPIVIPDYMRTGLPSSRVGSRDTSPMMQLDESSHHASLQQQEIYEKSMLDLDDDTTVVMDDSDDMTSSPLRNITALNSASTLNFPRKSVSGVFQNPSSPVSDSGSYLSCEPSDLSPSQSMDFSNPHAIDLSVNNDDAQIRHIQMSATDDMLSSSNGNVIIDLLDFDFLESDPLSNSEPLLNNHNNFNKSTKSSHKPDHVLPLTVNRAMSTSHPFENIVEASTGKLERLGIEQLVPMCGMKLAPVSVGEDFAGLNDDVGQFASVEMQDGSDTVASGIIELDLFDNGTSLVRNPYDTIAQSSSIQTCPCEDVFQNEPASTSILTQISSPDLAVDVIASSFPSSIYSTCSSPIDKATTLPSPLPINFPGQVNVQISVLDPTDFMAPLVESSSEPAGDTLSYVNTFCNLDEDDQLDLVENFCDKLANAQMHKLFEDYEATPAETVKDPDCLSYPTDIDLSYKENKFNGKDGLTMSTSPIMFHTSTYNQSSLVNVCSISTNPSLLLVNSDYVRSEPLMVVKTSDVLKPVSTHVAKNRSSANPSKVYNQIQHDTLYQESLDKFKPLPTTNKHSHISGNKQIYSTGNTMPSTVVASQPYQTTSNSSHTVRELEKHLRSRNINQLNQCSDLASEMPNSNRGNRDGVDESSCSSMLYKLLTDEISKDTYVQMDRKEQKSGQASQRQNFGAA